jgi:hypothetical protein
MVHGLGVTSPLSKDVSLLATLQSPGSVLSGVSRLAGPAMPLQGRPLTWMPV